MISDENDLQDSFEWSKAVQTGHEVIDSEHMRLFDLLEQLRGTIVIGVSIPDIVEQLREYSTFHFANEELIMDSFNYDDRTMHKNAHAGFLKKIESLQSKGSLIGDQAKPYVSFIYDWLVSHICSIDQVMVAKMRGTGPGYEDSLSDQTSLIIDAALKIANHLATLTNLLNDVKSPKDRHALKNEISNTSERLLNLVALADTRVGIWGGSTIHRQRMDALRTAVTKSACNLMEQYASKVIDYGGNILSGSIGIPLGCATVIGMWMTTITTLAHLVGNSPTLSVAQSAVILRSFHIANQVTALAQNHLKQPEFGRGDKHCDKQYEIPASIEARAESQSSVLSKVS